MEHDWKDRITACRLSQYEFSPRTFYPIDYCAGYYISEQVEIPVAVTTLEQPLELFAVRHVRIEFHENLEPIRQITAHSTYRFSNIRMKFLRKM